MAEKGLFIDIEGEVSRKLLRSMEKLKNKLHRLSNAAMRYSATAKAAGHGQLARNLDNLSRQVRGTANEMETNFNRISDAAERGRRATGENIDHLARDIAEGNAKIKRLQAPEAKEAPEVDTGAKKTGGPDPEELQLRNDLYNEYLRYLDQSKTSHRAAARRSNQLADVIANTRRAMGETGVIREHQQSFKGWTKDIDIARLRLMDLHGQLKITRNGFVELNDEAAEALDLDAGQVEALTGRTSKLRGEIDGLVTDMGTVEKKVEGLDFTDKAGINRTSKQVNQLRTRLYKLEEPIREMEGDEAFEYLADSVERYGTSIKTAEKENQRFFQQQKKNIDLYRKTGFEIQAADAATREYHTNRQKQVSETIQRTQELRDRMDRFDEIKYDPKQLRMLRKDIDSVVRNVDKLEEPMRLEWGDQGVESFKELRNEAYGLRQEYDDLTTQKKESIQLANKEQRARIKEQEAIEKQTLEVDNLKKSIREINETPIKTLPEGQLPEHQKHVRRLNAQLYQMKQHMTDDELKEFSDILLNTDRKLNRMVSTTEEYNRTGRRTTGMIGRLWRRFQRLSHAIIQQIHLWGIIGIVLVGAQAAYAGLATWATKAAASLSENAEKLNMSVQSMQELQAAATTTGTSVQDMNKALEELNTSVIDALKGKKKAKEAFQDLGIEFETLVNKGNDTEKMFELVMERLDEVDSSAKRLSIAEDLFGEGPASTLINLVGSLEEARDAMKQFDITMSEEAANSAEKLWNKFRGLWLVIKRQFISAAIEASHVMNNFADQILQAAAQGNIFEGTIVPAVKSTIGILEALYDIGKKVYWVLHRLYEAWGLVVVALKALMGLGFVHYLNRMYISLQNYVAATKGATAWTQRFGAALRWVLRTTGYFLIIEGIIKIVSWMQKASEVAKETELTFEEAFKAIVQRAIQGFVQSLKKAIPVMGEVLKEGALKLGRIFLVNFIKGALPGNQQINLMKKLATTWFKMFGVEFKKASEQAKMDLSAGIATEESMKKLDEWANKTNKKLKDMNIFENVTEGASESRKEMLKTAEVAEEASQDIINSVQQMADEGRIVDVERFLPFAMNEVKSKIDNVKKELDTYQKYVDHIRGLPPAVGPDEVDEEILRKLERLKTRLKDLKNEKEELADLPVKAIKDEFVDAWETANDKVEDITEDIKDKQDELAEHQKEANEEMREAVESNEDAIQSIRRASMDEQEKQMAKLKAARDKLLETEIDYFGGMADSDPEKLESAKERLKEIRDTYVELGKNAANSEDSVISQRKAMAMVEDLNYKIKRATEEKGEAEEDEIEKQLSNLEKAKNKWKDMSETIKSKMKTAIEKLAEMNEYVDEPKKLELNVDDNEVKNAIRRLDDLISRLNTVNNKQADINTSSTPKGRFGGFVGDQIRKLDVGGLLPGYGGGDRIKALLESGEFVMRKEAVSQYGRDLLQAMNQMDLPKDSLAQQLPQMQTGGFVGNQESTSAPQPEAADYGRLEIVIGDKNYPVTGRPDVLQELKKDLSKENLMRRNQ